MIPFFSRRIGLDEQGASIPMLGGTRLSGRVGSDIRWEQRVTNSPRWRHSFFEGSADYYTNPQGEVETRQQRVGVGLTLQNGAEVSVSAENTFDRLVELFPIRPGIILPIGDYDVSANSDPSRPLSGEIAASTGDFWNGSSQSVDDAITVQPGHHLRVSATLGVKLPAGDFTTALVGTRVLYGCTNAMFLSSNTRFRFIHRPLSDLFIVYNERRDPCKEQLIDRAVIVKFTNMFKL